VSTSAGQRAGKPTAAASRKGLNPCVRRPPKEAVLAILRCPRTFPVPAGNKKWPFSWENGLFSHEYENKIVTYGAGHGAEIAGKKGHLRGF
jgi:hypothetical protein